jgi:hypothetical protein
MIHVFFLEYSDTTNSFPVISDRVVHYGSESRREIVALERYDYPGTNSLLEDSFLSLGGKLAFLSLNSCTTVLVVFAAMTAYLCEGSSILPSPVMRNHKLTCSDLHPSIEIHEAHIKNVLSDQEVHVLYLTEDRSPVKVHVAEVHSMFRITTTKQDSAIVPAEPAQLDGTGLYCDTTAAQHGRISGLQDAKAYHRRHPDSKIVYYTSLGYYRHTHYLSQLDTTSVKPTKNRILALRQEAYIRTINNVVHKEIESIGGRARLFDMKFADFEVTYTTMAAHVQSALLKVTVELHELWADLPQDMGSGSIEHVDRHQVVVDRCMGAGHTACLRALQQRAPRAWVYADGQLASL